MSERLDYVLDSTALIALVLGEPGSERVQAILSQAAVNAINLTETVHKLVRKGLPAQEVERFFRDLQLNVVDWSERLAYESIEFAAVGAAQGLSLGDRSCLALAKHLKATAVTADTAWRRVKNLGVNVLLFR